MNVEKGERFLPIGTVVMLKGGTKKAMITGFCSVAQDEETKMYDYSGCIYPEGYVSSEQICLFDHSQIETVYFKGYIDDEEKMFKDKLNSLVSDINIPVQSTVQTQVTDMPAVEPVMPAVEPVMPAAESVMPAAESVMPAAESVMPAAEPVMPVAEPVMPAAEPVMPAAEPVMPVAEPVMPAAEPVMPVAEPAMPVAEPVMPAAEPVMPIAEPVMQADSQQ